MNTERLPNGTLLLQDERFLKLSADAILLAAACPEAERACDLGCGVGNVLLSLADRQPRCTLVGLEINRDPAEVCRSSIERNGLAGRVSVAVGDLRELASASGDLPYGLTAHSFDLVACNPPYLRAGSGKEPTDPARVLERVDRTAPPSAVASAAAALLSPHGAAVFVLRPDRLDDYTSALRSCGLEPCGLRLCAHDESSEPCFVLLRAETGGSRALDRRPTLVLSDAGGRPSPEYRAILDGAPLIL